MICKLELMHCVVPSADSSVAGFVELTMPFTGVKSSHIKLALDVSGSMAGPALMSMRAAVVRAIPMFQGSTMTIVSFNSRATMIVEAVCLDSEAIIGEVISKVESALSMADGGTSIGSALRMLFEEEVPSPQKRVCGVVKDTHVLLLTDGEDTEMRIRLLSKNEDDYLLNELKNAKHTTFHVVNIGDNVSADLAHLLIKAVKRGTENAIRNESQIESVLNNLVKYVENNIPHNIQLRIGGEEEQEIQLVKDKPKVVPFVATAATTSLITILSDYEKLEEFKVKITIGDGFDEMNAVCVPYEKRRITSLAIEDSGMLVAAGEFDEAVNVVQKALADLNVFGTGEEQLELSSLLQDINTRSTSAHRMLSRSHTLCTGSSLI